MPVLHLKDIGDISEINPGSDNMGVARELEIIAGLDNTRSMRNLLRGTQIMRAQVGIDALTDLAVRCWELDSQAKAEAAAGVKGPTGYPAGGLRVVRWGISGRDDGDWNPESMEPLSGLFDFDDRGTYIMTMWDTMEKIYVEEFCKDEETGEPIPPDQRPVLLLAGITDGAAFDNEKFEKKCRKLGGDTYLVLALIGSGDEYDRAAAKYGAIAESNPHFTLVLVGDDPAAAAHITEAFQRLAGQFTQAA